MNTNQTLEALNTICPGWTEAQPGGMLCNPNAGGGIIDNEITSGAWFVIFNDSRANLEGYATREDAIEAFAIASRQPATAPAGTKAKFQHEQTKQSAEHPGNPAFARAGTDGGGVPKAFG